MSERQIFNNYKDKCPICGGDLDASHSFCPYCGYDLKADNQQHRDNESIITGAIDDIDSAKKKLAYREKQYKENKKEKSTLKKILKWVLILCVVNFILFLGFGIVLTIIEDVNDKKVEKLRVELLNQVVDYVVYDEIDLSDYSFQDTEHKSAIGRIKQDDNIYAIPFYTNSYSSDGAFKGMTYVDTTGLEEVSSFTESRVTLYYEDCYFYIEAHNNYYDKTTDALYFHDSKTMNNTSRLDDVVIGEYTFECYKMDTDYIMICNPFGGCYLVIEGHATWDNEYFSFDEMMKVLKLECDFEI